MPIEVFGFPGHPIKVVNYLRWQCPHCQTTLVISDKKLGDSWSFSRCFNCGGFAFVRWSGVKLIKVDNNPLEESEKILIPSSETEINFEAPRQEKAITPAPTQMAPKAEKTEPKFIQPFTEQKEKEEIANKISVAASETEESLRKSFLDPRSKFDLKDTALEDEAPTVKISWKNQPWMNRAITIATAISGIFAIVSGVYLYRQGNALMSHKENVAEATTDEIQPSNKDVIKTSALAPKHATEKPTELLVTIRPPHVNLRSGPGLQFQAPTAVKRGTALKVVGWKDNWFHVQYPDNKRPPHLAAETELWIRNDMVAKSI